MKKLFLFLVLCLMLSPLRGKSFRFALLTDLHLNADTLAYNDLKRSIDQINKTGNLDFVIVSGDVTEEGDRASLKKVKFLLDQLNVKYYITSGNHETKWSESGATDFGHIFGADRFQFEHKGFLFLGFNSGPVLRMADGHVSPQDISSMKKEMEKVGKEKPVILITHYPLQEGDVDNWYEVTDAIRTFNIRAVLGGHYHSNRMMAYDGIPGIINRSNLRAKETVGGYSIYEINADSILVYEQKIGEEPRKWGGYSLMKSYFTSDNSGYKRPDFSVNSEYGKVREVWMKKSDAGIYSSPVIYSNNVYVGDDLGFLSCYSLKDGKKRWNFRTGNRIVGTPAAANGVVVFGSADKNIYGINAQNGKMLWKFPANEAVLGAVSIVDGMAYIGASDHSFRALEVKTGKLRWEYTGVKGYVETRPLIYQGKVIFGAWDNNLYTLDQTTGKELWKWDGNLTRMHFSPAAVWPVAANGKVFIADPQRALTAIDITNGTTVWRTFQSKVREAIGLSEDQQRVYGKTMQDSVVCFSTQGNAPKQIWATDVKFGYEHAPSMLQEKAGVLFGSTRSGLIFALDAFSGKLLWKHKVGNSLISTVVPLNATTCVFTSTGGEIGVITVPVSIKKKK